MILRFLKQWTLPVAIVVGTLTYILFAFVPQLDAAGNELGKVMDVLLPVMLFSQYKDVLHRYFINLTDHAWWLGKNCIDTNLEFRQFGLALSTEVRGIDKKKEALLPYYPVSQLNNETIDNLLPEGLEGKFVIVTGGTFYKYLDADYTLLKIVQRILRENDNAVLLKG